VSDHGYHALRVKRVIEETADTRSYVLDVPPDLAETFRYRPGQFCTFRVRLDGDELLRCYSMSSAPATDDDLTVTVKRVDGGRVSNWFLDHVAEGDVLDVTKPAGVFCTHEADRLIVCFAGGSGVTPIMSIAKSELAQSDRRVRLLYANRDANSIIFRDQLDQLAGPLEVQHHLDAERGFLTTNDIRAFVGADVDADFFICGPGPFMDLVESTLHDLGVADDRIAIERFINANEIAPVAAPSVATDEAPAEVTVILKGKRHTIAYQPGDTLLNTARRGGLNPPFSCEAGNCASCMAMLHEGTVTMRANNALDEDEVAEGWVLTCQSVPAGPVVTVEYE
jgi:3-ketosteroid 9alpha-monooxygenase subunit B